jgi:hypothetical protein
MKASVKKVTCVVSQAKERHWFNFRTIKKGKRRRKRKNL